MKLKNIYSIKLPSQNALSAPMPTASVKPAPKKAVKRKAKAKTAKKGGWRVTFSDGHTVDTPYYPNPRMAAGYALKQHGKGTIKGIRFM